jgi:hypothetical protein
MSGLITLVGALALVCVPLALDRIDSLLPPRWAVRFGAASLLAGSGIWHLALGLIAAPTVLRALDLHYLAGVCGRLLLHLGVSVPGYLAWPALLLLAASSITFARGTFSAFRADRELRQVIPVEAAASIDSYPVTLLDTSAAFAFGVGGRRPRIVITSGLDQQLTPEEREVVLAHEAAHLRNGDPRLLRWLRAVELGSSRAPLVVKSVAAVRLAIERSADEVATGQDAARRRAAARAILVATGLEDPFLPALSQADTIARRVRALLGPSNPPALFSVIAVVGGLSLLPLAVSVWGVATWISHSHLALSLVGWCPI